jgi:uncharacterized protein YacL
MLLHILRALFVLVMAAVGYSGIRFGLPESVLALTVTLGVLIVAVDILAPRRKLIILSGTFLGLLVGMMMSYAFSFVVTLVIDQVQGGPISPSNPYVQFINLLIGAVCCFLAISFILQSKDDFRFIIPYVEFRRQAKGVRPLVVDTSVLIDGRIAELAETGLLHAPLIVPRFVLRELQTIADQGDRLKRNRGRRGLDVLARLQQNPRVEVTLYEIGHHDDGDAQEGVDQRLVRLAKELDGRLLTMDFNLNKVAQVAGLEVINLNDVAAAVRSSAVPGETLRVKVIRAGEEAGQGVGFLEDGTMVVVEGGRGHVGEDVDFVITNSRQTSAGRMIFGRIADADGNSGNGNGGAAAAEPSDARPPRRGGRQPHGPRGREPRPQSAPAVDRE